MTEILEEEQATLVSDLNPSITKSLHSPFDIIIHKYSSDLIDRGLKKQSAASCAILSEKGLKGGTLHMGHTLSPEGIAWMEKAIRAHHKNRILGVLNQIGVQPDRIVLGLWKKLLRESYQNQKARIKELYEAIMKDDQFNQATKNWLKKYLIFNK